MYIPIRRYEMRDYTTVSIKNKMIREIDENLPNDAFSMSRAEFVRHAVEERIRKMKK